MSNLISIFLTMSLVNNMVLVRFLGLCPFFGVSKKTSSAFSMGIAVTLVMTIASAATWPIYRWMLVPFGFEFSRTVIFILVIASLVQIVEMTIKRTNAKLYSALGIYLPLITTNCAVLGVTFIMSEQGFSFLEAVSSALGAGVGFTLVLLIMSGIRERLEVADVPRVFRGTPIALLVAGVLGLAFLAFGGMKL